MQDHIFGARRLPFRRGLHALALILVFTPLTLAAQNSATPEEVIDAYYQAVKDGDCDRAMRLRPGYSRSACEGIRDIPIWTSRVLEEDGKRAAMLIFVEVQRDGSDVRDTFQGFVLLDRSGDGWLIDTKSYKNATDEFGPNDYVARHFPDAIAAPVTETPLTDTAALAPTALTSPAIETVALPDTGYAGAEPMTGSAEPAGADPEAAAMETFQAYYDALAIGDCDNAMKLRSSQTRQGCQEISAVLQASASVVGQIEGQVALRAKIALRRLKGGDPDYLDDFRGFLTVSRQQQGWIIDGASYQSESGGLTPDAYLVAIGMTAPAPEDPTAEEIARRLSNGGATSGTGVAFWANGAPRVFGSGAVMAACWSDGELAGRREEKKTSKTAPGAYMRGPERYEPNVMLTPLPAKYQRSIRRVDTGGRKLVALTFDTGEQNNDLAGYDGEIVDYLRRNRIKATFYFGGKWMATHRERAMQIIADPLFESGNHAWTHGNMRVLTGQDAMDQILFTQAQYEVLLEELGSRPCAQQAGLQAFQEIPAAIPTFRYPYGTCSAETLKMVNDLGLPAVQWDVVSADPARGQTADAMADAILRETKPGSIVIMHSNGRGWNTGKALPKFVPVLKERGYEFVTVSELLAYGEPVAKNECYERKPGDNKHYDRIFGRGTGD